MDYEIVYDAEARVELKKAFEWSRVRTSVTQATQFLDAIDAGLEEILTFPEAHQIIHPSGIRRFRVAGFRTTSFTWLIPMPSTSWPSQVTTANRTTGCIASIRTTKPDHQGDP
jgi:plasmid stabilization system protein ParE